MFVVEGDLRRGWTFDVVEQAPYLIGGISGLHSALKYPTDALAAGISGRVHVEFVINTQGVIQEIRVVQSVNASLDQEAV